MCAGDGKPQKNGLDEPLVQKQVVEDGASFDKSEMTKMLSIAWPMMVSFFCRMGMASVDSAFVGHLTTGGFTPATYLAAAGLADMVTNILVSPPLAFNSSLNALVSQAVGSGNKKMAGTWLQLSVFFLTIGYLPCLVSFFYVSEVLGMLGFSPELCELAGAYAKWNVIWPIPNGWYQCMRFYFQAQGITRPAMYNNIIFLCVNILLNWIFVFGGPFRYLCGWEGLGFVGAAISLSCSRTMQPIAYWLYMFAYKGAHHETWPGWSLDFLQRSRVSVFLEQSMPQVGTSLLQSILGQATTLLMAQLGPLAIAASSAAQALLQVFTGGISATLSAVTGVRVGYHLGSGNGDGARRASWIIFRISFYSCALVSILVLPFGYQAISIMTIDEEVRVLGAKLLPAMMLSTFTGLIVQCGTGGVFTSQGRVVLATVLAMGVELPLTIGSMAVCVLVLHWGLVSVFWAQAAVTTFEAVIVLLIFIRSDWVQCAKDAKARQEIEDNGDAGVGAFSTPVVPACMFVSPGLKEMPLLDRSEGDNGASVV